jgi:hypothetical protein
MGGAKSAVVFARVPRVRGAILSAVFSRQATGVQPAGFRQLKRADVINLKQRVSA